MSPDDETKRRRAQIQANIKIGDDVTLPLMPTIMALKEMIERLIYVGEQGLVADSETGRVRKAQRLRRIRGVDSLVHR